MTWISVPEYSKLIGKTPQYINRTIKSRKITKKALKKKGSRFLVDPDQANKDLMDNTSYVNKKPVVKHSLKKPEKETKKKPNSSDDPNPEQMAKTSIKAGTSGLSMSQAQTIQAQYKAALLKLEYEEKSGKLVAVEQVGKEAYDCGRRTRDAILNVPDRVVAEIISSADIHKGTKILIEALTEALEELTNGN